MKLMKKNGIVYATKGYSYNNKFLHTQCDEFNIHYKLYKSTLVWRLKRYLLMNEKAVGIAANQLGMNVMAFAIRRNSGKIQVFVNPFLIQHGGEKTEDEESCLSVKGSYLVKRWDYIEFKVIEDDREVKYQFRGWEARVVSHELDHLSGTLISDEIHNNY